MTGPREVVQTHPAVWDVATPVPAAAWLLGYVRTDVPGYREILMDGVLYVVASGEYRFDDFIDAIDAVAVTDQQDWWDYGAVAGQGVPVTFPDRLGWVLGRGTEAGASLADSGVIRFVPPAGIPLMGATWTKAETDADRRQILDRHKRNQGYVWGGASLWSCRLVMHRWALEALQIGWCLRGKVTLGCADMLDTPVSASEPRGAITGYALGLDSVSWLDSIQHTARVEMTIVTS